MLPQIEMEEQEPSKDHFDFPSLSSKCDPSLFHTANPGRLDEEISLIPPSSFTLGYDFEPLPLSMDDWALKTETNQGMLLEALFKSTSKCQSKRYPYTSSESTMDYRSIPNEEVNGDNVTVDDHDGTDKESTQGDTSSSSLPSLSSDEDEINDEPNEESKEENDSKAKTKTKGIMLLPSTQMTTPQEETKTVVKSIPKSASSFMLPKSFSLSPDSVIVGRGKFVKLTSGNKKLRKLAEEKLNKYASASRKKDKSLVVIEVFKIIEEKCPVGAFVKLVNGRWWQVSDAVAREKIGYIFRDMLSWKYSSTSASKTARQNAKKRLTNKYVMASKADIFNSLECDN